MLKPVSGADRVRRSNLVNVISLAAKWSKQVELVNEAHLRRDVAIDI
jgi:hypothetical protein